MTEHMRYTQSPKSTASTVSLLVVVLLVVGSPFGALQVGGSSPPDDHLSGVDHSTGIPASALASQDESSVNALDGTVAVGTAGNETDEITDWHVGEGDQTVGTLNGTIDEWHELEFDPTTATYPVEYTTPRVLGESLDGEAALRVVDEETGEELARVNQEVSVGIEWRSFGVRDDETDVRLGGRLALEPRHAFDPAIGPDDDGATDHFWAARFRGENLQPGEEYTFTVEGENEDGRTVREEFIGIIVATQRSRWPINRPRLSVPNWEIYELLR